MKLKTFTQYEEALHKLDVALICIMQEMLVKAENCTDDELSSFYDIASDEIDTLMDHEDRVVHILHLFNKDNIDFIKRELRK